MRVLIAFASRMGSTAEIASAVSSILEETGCDVTVTASADAEPPEGYDAVIVGSALYFHRWENDAVSYLARHASALAQRPTWLFQSGPIGAGAENAAVEVPHRVLALSTRLGIDPPVTFEGRLEAARAHGPLSRWVAGGDLAGDYRDWDEIRSWARDIAVRLTAAATHGLSPKAARALGPDADKTP